MLNQLKNMFELKIDHLNGRVRADEPGSSTSERYVTLVRLQLELLAVEREVIDQQIKKGEMSDELLRKLDQELDLEAVRLASSIPADQLQ